MNMTTESYTAIRTEGTPVNFNYKVKFDRTVTDPSEWHEEIDIIRLAREGDHVTIYLNTEGGNAATMVETLHAINTSDAHFHCVLAGNAYSAGGPIMLACDTVEIGQFADMMVHTVQTGYCGPSGSMKKFSDHSVLTAENILRTCYKGFCTEKELDKVLLGDELWLDAEEISRRLKIRDKYRETEFKESIDDEMIATNIASMTEDLIYSADQLAMNPKELLTLLTESLSNVSCDEEEPLVEGSCFNITPSQQELLHEWDDNTLVDAMLLEDGTLRLEWRLESDEDMDWFEITAEGELADDLGDFPCFVTQLEFGAIQASYLKGAAKLLQVKSAHNLSPVKLAKRLEEKVNYIVDKLNY